jgi:acyl carrier protein
VKDEGRGEEDCVVVDFDKAEAVLAEIGRILSVQKVERTDNIFLLGGDSLSALEILELCDREFGTTLEVERVLDAANFGELFEICGRAS